ncbi:ACT domain-containing protein [Burkholderia multivorans]|uniref:ACT domain-containing protein n=1 Tax=Burkholderia multivorans TaxID=87883 RepID=UPI001F14AD22|nr:ACT domain-containing protein [Burkholderia multivorans]
MSEKDLAKLCATIEPEMAEPVYVYCSFPDFRLPEWISALCTFREIEGLTAVVNLEDAERGALPYTFKARLITLQVHSSLDAVGFLAVVSEHLAKAKIPCNAIAGYYHDHILVPVDRADEAIAVLIGIRHASVSSLLE